MSTDMPTALIGCRLGSQEISAMGAASGAVLDRRLRKGLAFGLVTALMAATSFTMARAGVVGGLDPADLVFLRFSVSGILLLPILLREGAATLAGIGWLRAIAITLAAGPIFVLMQTSGYLFSPLAHGAVLAPGTVTLFTMVLGTALLGERLTAARLVGTCVVIVGILLIALEGLAVDPGGVSWIGDLLFVGSGVLWTAYTLLLRRWDLKAGRASAVVSVLALLITAPIYLVTTGVSHLVDLPARTLAGQIVAQGLFGGVFLMLAYGRAVTLLGAGRAALFSSVVPALAVILGIPLIGELPTLIQAIGIAIVTLGMLVAIGLADGLLAGDAKQ